MALNKADISLISNVGSNGSQGVSNAHVLTYVAANSAVEFKELNLVVAGAGTVSANADAINTQRSANIDTVQDNVTSTLSLLTLANTNIDTVQGNLDSYATYANSNFKTAANSFSTIAVGDSNVEASTTSSNLFLLAGNGVALSSNSDGQSITFTMHAGTVDADYYVLDGTANTATLTYDNRPAHTLLVTLGGIMQEQGIDYTISSTTLTLNNTYPILNGTDLEVLYLPYTGEYTATSSSSSGFQGSTSGYFVGGDAINPAPNPFNATSAQSTIEKFSLTSDANATDIAELSAAQNQHSTQSSSTHGYACTGEPSATLMNKFPFTSNSPASDIGELAIGSTSGPSDYSAGGCSSSTNGYSVAGQSPAASFTAIQKFPFSSDTGATNTGDLARASVPINGAGGASASSGTNGYIAGGGTTRQNIIDKFPFSSDTNGTDVGDLATTIHQNMGTNSDTHGYSSGGFDDTTYVDTIQKYPFSSDTNSSDVGELSAARWLLGSVGVSSTSSGYTTGGRGPGVTRQTNIDKASFSSDSSATNVASLSQGRGLASGNHV